MWVGKNSNRVDLLSTDGKRGMWGKGSKARKEKSQPRKSLGTSDVPVVGLSPGQAQEGQALGDLQETLHDRTPHMLNVVSLYTGLKIGTCLNGFRGA